MVLSRLKFITNEMILTLIFGFPFLDGDDTRSTTSYGVFISQRIGLLKCPVLLMTLILVIRF